MQKSRLFLLLITLFLSMSFIPAHAGDDEDEEEEKAPEVMYVDMSPAFIVNLGNNVAASNYLKAEVQLVVDGEDEADKIRYHVAPIRHELVMLLSSKTKEELKSPEAREALQTQALENMNKHLDLMEKNLKIEEVLFTTFIVQ